MRVFHSRCSLNKVDCWVLSDEKDELGMRLGGITILFIPAHYLPAAHFTLPFDFLKILKLLPSASGRTSFLGWAVTAAKTTTVLRAY